MTMSPSVGTTPLPNCSDRRNAVCSRNSLTSFLLETISRVDDGDIDELSSCIWNLTEYLLVAQPFPDPTTLEHISNIRTRIRVFFRYESSFAFSHLPEREMFSSRVQQLYRAYKVLYRLIGCHIDREDEISQYMPCINTLKDFLIDH